MRVPRTGAGQFSPARAQWSTGWQAACTCRTADLRCLAPGKRRSAPTFSSDGAAHRGEIADSGLTAKGPRDDEAALDEEQEGVERDHGDEAQRHDREEDPAVVESARPGVVSTWSRSHYQVGKEERANSRLAEE